MQSIDVYKMQFPETDLISSYNFDLFYHLVKVTDEFIPYLGTLITLVCPILSRKFLGIQLLGIEIICSYPCLPNIF